MLAEYYHYTRRQASDAIGCAYGPAGGSKPAEQDLIIHPLGGQA